MADSVWRLRARPIIARVLDGLPPGATEKEARAALTAAYPFGERRHHPYRMWLAEVNAQVALRFGRRKKRPPQVRVGPGGVLCGWCRNDAAPCFCCSDLCRRFASCVADKGLWQGWLKLMGEDPEGTVPAYADWLEENGWPEEAALVRSENRR